MALRQVTAGIALAAIASAAGAQVYRCTDARGAVTFQEQACPVTSDERVTTIPTSYPEANLRERERLLARAEAADARLLKRLDQKTRDRTAREHRLAGEAAEKVGRGRAPAAEAAGGILVVAMPQPRPHRPRYRKPRPIAFN